MYYKIENKTDSEVGNIFPQVSCINHQLAHAIHFDEFVSFDQELSFQLQSKAKLTDVLSQASISACGILISERFSDIISNYTLANHRLYRALVTDHKGKYHKYFWLHFVDNELKFSVNYSKSTFYWTRSTFRKGILELDSYEQYLKLKSENGSLWGVDIDTVVLNRSKYQNLDMISCIPFDIGVYLNETLKENLENEKITGINFIDAPNIVFDAS